MAARRLYPWHWPRLWWRITVEILLIGAAVVFLVLALTSQATKQRYDNAANCSPDSVSPNDAGLRSTSCKQEVSVRLTGITRDSNTWFHVTLPDGYHTAYEVQLHPKIPASLTHVARVTAEYFEGNPVALRGPDGKSIQLNDNPDANVSSFWGAFGVMVFLSILWGFYIWLRWRFPSFFRVRIRTSPASRV
jgi:hypothetical protein